MPPSDVGDAPAAATDARQAIAHALATIVRKRSPEAADFDVQVERPRDPAHGDYATNVALVAGKRLGKPRELAEALAHELEAALPDLVERVDVAGPGFINIRITPAARQRVVRE